MKPPPISRSSLFTALSAASLLLCLATVVLWSRSDRLDQSLRCRIRSDRFSIRCVHGHMAAGRFTPADGVLAEPRVSWEQIPLLANEESDLEWEIGDQPAGEKTVSPWLGCHLARDDVSGDIQWWAEAPARPVAIFFALLPALWLATRWPRHWRQAGSR